MNLQLINLSKSYKGKWVFENINGQINDGDRIGLIGTNGVGKTTLARLLAGIEESDTGRITRSPSYIDVLYVQQYPEFDEGVTVYEEACRAVSRSLRDVGPAAEKALNEVGLGKDTWRQRARDLSGGEKTKLLLCRALLKNFELLILDEPTNHLDMEACVWLEGFVAAQKTPMLIISHDRYFLDSTVNRIWELTPGSLREYEGNYSAYRDQKGIEEKSIAKEYQKQQTRIQHLKQVIYERKGWYESAHKSAGQNDFYRSKAKKHAQVLKAKERELERVAAEKIDKPRKAVSPAFEVINKGVAAQRLPPFLVKGKGITKAFGQRPLFEDVTFNIKRREKIALIGQNGVGKTTLFRILCGEEGDFGGTLTVNPSVRIGYFAQEFDNLNSDATILDEMLAVGALEQEVRLLLAGLLFRGDDVFKGIGNLSMGERGRVAFAKLILSGANLLVLDEPTNHMDIGSREKIEEVLGEFGGSIIFVTHDRYFIKKLADRVFVIEDKRLRCYDGGYAYYLSKLKEKRAKERAGADYGRLLDDIRKLECQLAFLGGRLSETSDEDEKERLNREYLETARTLSRYKNRLKVQR
ncbi:MAG: ABC-F family ATP-binding cassette domain-containing protein [Bacillota bacterium]|nr:ABC-F family ATP-binding cassette domain-containing protein [Bacillota bacterium]MDD3298850.1 ABC-F family ATP-binding cassette domain-containing protein [Bacillota bacterium]MDD3851323.1 ABC-F family ATP-binding cassette domain-containing protein [Bacillota bacterium]MDD4708441.1 ABC-F family ATP-binding cassette domain-containing protein [Bacillota bacterium]